MHNHAVSNQQDQRPQKALWAAEGLPCADACALFVLLQDKPLLYGVDVSSSKMFRSQRVRKAAAFAAVAHAGQVREQQGCALDRHQAHQAAATAEAATQQQCATSLAFAAHSFPELMRGRQQRQQQGYSVSLP